MKQPLIEVNDIWKKYKVGASLPYFTLRDNVSGFMKNPLQFIKHEDSSTGELKQNEFWALKKLTFNIYEGEIVGIIGKNGAGKSTILKILSRITPPTKGEVKIRGKIASLLEVGTGFQQELTGRENIYLNGAILGMKQSDIKQKFDEIVEFAEIKKFLDTPVKHYSTGMYMRLAFSIAAHLDPDILIVDEVLAVGDISFQQKCIGKMGDVAQKGKTVLFVSHNLDAVKRLCNKTMLMDKGTLLEFDETAKVISKYVDSYKQGKTQTKFQAQKNKKIDFQVNKAVIKNKENEACAAFNLLEDIYLEIEYEVKKDLQGSNIEIEILKNGDSFLRSYDIDVDVKSFQLRKKGKYIVKIPIPSKTFPIGEYQINIKTSIPSLNKKIDEQNEVLAFSIMPTSDNLGYKSYHHDAILVSNLPWDTKKVE